MGIENKVDVIGYEGLAEFLEDMDVEETEDWIYDLEKENPDMSVFIDVHLSALIDTLEYNGMKEDEIVEYSKRLYGNVIEFYKIKSENGSFYVMLFGAR